MHVRRHLNRLTESGGRVRSFFHRLNTLRTSDSTSHLLHPKEEESRLEKNITNSELRTGEEAAFGIICTTAGLALGVNEESIGHKAEKMKSRRKRLLRDLKKSGKEMRKVLRSGFLALGKSMIHASELLPQPYDFAKFQPSYYDDDEFNFQHYKTYYESQLDTYSLNVI